MSSDYKDYEMEHVVVFDFDGTLTTYKSGWEGAGVISDPPVKGMRELFRKLKTAGMTIKIFSCRAATLEGFRAIVTWLTKERLIEYVESVVDTKPVARCYVDDRAISFTGDVQELFWKIMNFKSWTEEAGYEEKDAR